MLPTIARSAGYSNGVFAHLSVCFVPFRFVKDGCFPPACCVQETGCNRQAKDCVSDERIWDEGGRKSGITP